MCSQSSQRCLPECSYSVNPMDFTELGDQEGLVGAEVF